MILFRNVSCRLQNQIRVEFFAHRQMLTVIIDHVHLCLYFARGLLAAALHNQLYETEFKQICLFWSKNSQHDTDMVLQSLSKQTSIALHCILSYVRLDRSPCALPPYRVTFGV